MNTYGLTISAQTLSISKYADRTGKDTEHQICLNMFIPWVLGNFKNVAEFQEGFEDYDIVGPNKYLSPTQKLHWSITDTTGKTVVLEYINGEKVWHDNMVGVMTNDPDFQFHQKNLNTYVNVNQYQPTVDAKMMVETDVGAVPQPLGVGWGLSGLPGDTSPPSRFVKTFYLT
eukprot:UN24446